MWHVDGQLRYARDLRGGLRIHYVRAVGDERMIGEGGGGLV
jgi:hypothetical protein